MSFCIPCISSPISFVLFADLSANLLTSSATTAKPIPCSPALAASMAALRANRLVCSAISSITSTIFPISSALPPSVRIVSAELAIALLTSFILLDDLSTALLPKRTVSLDLCDSSTSLLAFSATLCIDAISSSIALDV